MPKVKFVAAGIPICITYAPNHFYSSMPLLVFQENLIQWVSVGEIKFNDLFNTN